MKNNNIFNYVTAPAPRYVLRLSIIDYLLDKYVAKTINEFIEIGPGRGDVSAYIASTYTCHGTLYEMSREAVHFLKNRKDIPKNVKLINNKIENHVPKKMADLLLAFEVIEHVYDEKLFLDALHRSLLPGGILLLSVPAYDKNWTNQDEWAGHVRRYEKQQILGTVCSGGFKILSIKEYGFPLTSLMRPLKNIFYGKNPKISLEKKTMQSGLQRGLFTKIPFCLLLPIYWPFMKLQGLKNTEGLGDGFVLAAECRD